VVSSLSPYKRNPKSMNRCSTSIASTLSIDAPSAKNERNSVPKQHPTSSNLIDHYDPNKHLGELSKAFIHSPRGRKSRLQLCVMRMIPRTSCFGFKISYTSTAIDHYNTLKETVFTDALQVPNRKSFQPNLLRFRDGFALGLHQNTVH